MLDYLKRENAYAKGVMAPTEDVQSKLFDELVARQQPDEASVPVLDHGYWYYSRYLSGFEYPVYARRPSEMTAPEEVLLDGNAMAAGHDFFALGRVRVSPDGKRVAYTEDLVGRRQYTLHVRDIASGQVLPDAIDNVEADFEWAADSATLLYVDKDPVTLLSVRVYKHRLGTARAHDPLVYREKDASFYISLHRSRSERFLLIELRSTRQSEWLYAEAADPAVRFRPVSPRHGEHLYDVEALGDEFIIRTNWHAPNYRLVRVPVGQSSDPDRWRDIVATDGDAFIESFEVSALGLAYTERRAGLKRLRIRPWAGGETRTIPAIDASGVVDIEATPDIRSSRIRYVVESLISPEQTFEIDLASGMTELKKTRKVLGGFDKDNYRTEFHWAIARDGTRIPVSIAYRRSTPLDGTAPLFQYAYGAYGSCSDPTFASEWVSLMDRGFVVAIAHIRGGQEMGRRWYDDGRLLNKKNTFTDFIDVTRFLTGKRIAAPDKVFAEGASAGGLLMGAVANMAPENYRGIVAYVPFVDAVTTMLDASIPLTSNEFDEWGDPRQKPYYDYMLSYSPYDNVAAKTYPALLVFSALWDSQVQYYEPTKWVAKLRARKTDSNPLVFKVDVAAGHGGKSGRFQSQLDTALEYAFILSLLDNGG